MITANLDHKKDICEIEARGKIAEITNEVADIVQNVYVALDEQHKALFRRALIQAIAEGELLSEGGSDDEC